nr:hypothetical protein CFP56_00755 [Quercus suber]
MPPPQKPKSHADAPAPETPHAVLGDEKTLVTPTDLHMDEQPFAMRFAQSVPAEVLALIRPADAAVPADLDARRRRLELVLGAHVGYATHRRERMRGLGAVQLLPHGRLEQSLAVLVIPHLRPPAVADRLVARHVEQREDVFGDGVGAQLEVVPPLVGGKIVARLRGSKGRCRRGDVGRQRELIDAASSLALGVWGDRDRVGVVQRHPREVFRIQRGGREGDALVVEHDAVLAPLAGIEMGHLLPIGGRGFAVAQQHAGDFLVGPDVREIILVAVVMLVLLVKRLAHELHGHLEDVANILDRAHDGSRVQPARPVLLPGGMIGDGTEGLPVQRRIWHGPACRASPAGGPADLVRAEQHGLADGRAAVVLAQDALLFQALVGLVDGAVVALDEDIRAGLHPDVVGIQLQHEVVVHGRGQRLQVGQRLRDLEQMRLGAVVLAMAAPADQDGLRVAQDGGAQQQPAEVDVGGGGGEQQMEAAEGLRAGGTGVGAERVLDVGQALLRDRGRRVADEQGDEQHGRDDEHEPLDRDHGGHEWSDTDKWGCIWYVYGVMGGIRGRSRRRLTLVAWRMSYGG